ncbi:MAG TPA: metallophosphoesterase [Polyangiaceae bacterium]|jgi:hypothetical protein|nr:MAG: Calcineurin-like phosphoesterase superfamily domain protein [Deltaproteobacteria bacterium ADurb.Bin207]HNZ21775.1 metallophosphoesterase [Polyangiaceae bacterium]HOD25018.1 metallophosphoesterase [Polyangiaceae bacterium]HOE51366.1 metallophosphoesterase [Polyangiaceae bacterium]HOG99664.1 metallophosphoesterase [Polyangiaceae bacterium]
MIIAHLSDFHISRHGSRLTQLQDAAWRANGESGWETIRRVGDWRIQTRPPKRLHIHHRLRLVDDIGVVHRVMKVGRGYRSKTESIDMLLTFLEARERTTPQALAQKFPSTRQLERLLSLDPDNINLRFCAVAHAIRRAKPDHLVVTGDVTDDAEGFELVLEGFEPFFSTGRVSIVPGNHDVYPSPPLWVAKKYRKTEAAKRMLWATFSSSLGLPPSGSHVRVLERGVLLVCLDSCHRARVLGSASGLVPMGDLHEMARQLDASGKGIRIACLHHHILNFPAKGLGIAPLQPGMRLRNAKEVYAQLKELGFRLVMNGHRHVGYRFHPAMAPLFLSSPSSTIGCRSGARPYYWQIEVDRHGLHQVKECPIP